MTSPSYIINDANGNAHTYQDVGSALSAVTESMQVIAPNLKYMKFGPTDAAQAQATGTDAVAIGGNAFAMGPQALAIGRRARAQGDQAMALGASATANTDRGVALGYGAIASGRTQWPSATTPPPRRKTRLPWVAPGISAASSTWPREGDTDAVNTGQVNKMLAGLNNQPAPETRRALSAESKSSVPLENLIVAGPTDKPSETQATKRDAIAIGLTARADADRAVAIGSNAIVGGVNSVAVGSNVSADGANSIALGVRATAVADGSMALGFLAGLMLNARL